MLKSTVTTRRRVLAASGLLAAGGLAGCLNQVAKRTTNTSASPAAMFGGIRDDHLIAVTPGDTVRLTPSIRVDEQFVSGEIEFEAWVTNTVCSPTTDYNSTRSNRRKGTFEGGSDADSPQRSASIVRLQELTDASDDEIDALYEYLEDEPVLGERCVITLPDARAPRGGPTAEEMITPNRLIHYVTGRASDTGEVLAWGGTQVAMAAEDDDEDDDDDSSCEEQSSGLSTPTILHCWGDNSTTAISGPIHTYGSLDVIQSNVGVCVINSPPEATDEKATIGVTSDGEPTDVDDLADWGREAGPSSSTSTIVCQVLVQPAGCPCPFPALLHVQRHKNNDQYIYTCGWVIDDSCLYEDSTTALTATQRGGGGGGRVSVATFSAFEGGEVSGEAIKRVLPDDVSPIGAQLYDGTLRGAIRAGVLPDDELAERVAQTVDHDGDIHCVCRPFDGSCLHLEDDEDTSTEVKFKAGAELSKSVN